MSDKKSGSTQQILEAGEPLAKGNRVPQYAAGLASTLGALAAGMVLAWTSPAGENGVELKKAYPGVLITNSEFSWIGSLTPLGAGAICVPIGILADLIGRKYSMLLMVVPFTVGWACIIFANSVAMFLAGRFITGLSSGAFCVVAPMYAAEIAEQDIRGSLGSYFQLMMTIGILITYSLGTAVDMYVLSIISAVVPLVFFAVFSFMPETPMYYLKKGDEDAARSSLLRLRGQHYDVERELSAQKQSMEESARNDASFLTSLRSKATKRALAIAFGLMFFQQLSGVNAVIFYCADIFKSAGSTLDPNTATIIVGAMQVSSVFVSTLIVDRLGRRLLLLCSIVTMCASILVLAVYMYLRAVGTNLEGIGWLPVLSLCVYIVLFSLGFGPIPWMMMGEIFAPEVKGVAASSACLFNWLMAFIVTKFYADLNNVMKNYGTFFLFSAICAVGIFFVAFLVPETKGKSLDEIQRELDE